MYKFRPQGERSAERQKEYAHHVRTTVHAKRAGGDEGDLVGSNGKLPRDCTGNGMQPERDGRRR